MALPLLSQTLPLWGDAVASGNTASGVPDEPARLRAWAPEAWPVAPDWLLLLQTFWSGPDGRRLAHFVKTRLEAGAVIYPEHPLRALELTALQDVRVVILGQDPYHGAGQAEGLAFSVPDTIRPPPSLRNIYKELVRDQGGVVPVGGSLRHWAEQGVLLLNTSLTVEAGAPASHARQGWEVLTDALISACSQQGRPKVFMLWGAHAQSKVALLDAQRHLVLQSNHPSPLSANRPPVPFMGCGHFGQANEWLKKNQEKIVAWQKNS